jgi:hypothetical protein
MFRRQSGRISLFVPTLIDLIVFNCDKDQKQKHLKARIRRANEAHETFITKLNLNCWNILFDVILLIVSL